VVGGWCREVEGKCDGVGWENGDEVYWAILYWGKVYFAIVLLWVGGVGLFSRPWIIDLMLIIGKA
jgi:hypothetical protein